MGYEVDVLGVGEKSTSGDAIAIRYGNLHGSREEQTVVVIDGGYKGDGAKLVEHI
ncbi:MBL fold hydrolase, partial [Marinobacter sp. Z-F4-2]